MTIISSRLPPPKAPAAAPRIRSPTAAPKAAAAGLLRQLGGRDSPARYGPPKMLKGSIVLQVAAVTRAKRRAGHGGRAAAEEIPVLRRRSRVRQLLSRAGRAVPDERAAEAAKSALDRAGFKAIIKR